MLISNSFQRDRQRGRRFPTLAVGLAVACLFAGTSSAQDDCVGFRKRVVVDEGTNGVEALHAADLDGDGDIDLLSASFGDGKLFWYENDPATPGRFTPHLVSDAMISASDVSAADVDGDGHMDIVGTARGNNLVAWFRNNGGSPPLFTGTTVSGSLDVPLGIHPADLDDDGDVDLLVASFIDNAITWFENDGAATPLFTAHTISTTAQGAAAVHAADLDRDGDLDVLSASRIDDKIAWYQSDLTEIVDNSRPTFTEHVLSTLADGAEAVFAADLDGDGDLDVLSASQGDDTIAWYESDSDQRAPGEMPTFTRRTISSQADRATGVYAADLDGDDDLDVVSSSADDGKIAWYRNDGDGGSGLVFVEMVPLDVAAPGANDVLAVDLDGGGIDVVAAASLAGFPATGDKIAWYRNDGAAPPTPPSFEELAIGASADGAVAVAAGDFDDDGQIDVVAARRTNDIVLYRDADPGPSAEFVERSLAMMIADPASLVGDDLNADGYLDLVFAGGDTVAWYRNQGPPDFTFAEQILADDLSDARSAIVADLDDDGAPDILAASSGDDSVLLFENDPATPGSFSPRIVVTDEATAVRSLAAADLDDDGLNDVIVAAAGDGEIAGKLAWYKRNDVDPLVFVEHEIAVLSGASAVAAGNLDGEGGIDVVAGSEELGTVMWYKSDGASPPSFLARTVGASGTDVTFVAAEDLDGDQDEDVLVVAAGSGRIDLYVSDGLAEPTFGFQLVDGAADGVRSVSLVDFDGDGDLDLTAGERLRVSWHETSGEICDGFDATNDGRIDGEELVWIGRAFGASSADPNVDPELLPVIAAVDYSEDGMIDGDDLAILGAPGVFGRSTTGCYFVCVP